ncbi:MULTISPECIES: 3'-5' exonuclease [Chryseobacterium]|jgi:DNA polymerase-3 subunit epsilon|uniref:DNA polymerase-3 subunit epsilon n=1 Tax=Chryseobacterium balustinum TaxID=246 RepID=A0AAX2IHL3_9FLAO|nr:MULTISPECIES: 3'-5' exonuclease [Chryseobacterium]AZB31200.1 3'-5' exonuclease [Chryseobacterium balustinum]MDY0929646.1 3'-5' exonuclease [Chryseobacterium sp. CFBP8996]SKB38710.1 DNA polymerase-3 subunit epsilon [Chryseobacterium balustinum]SQA87931.1 Probable ATP-dependent helicase dinG homolog [Chryseobacterium balustinum]
MYSIIDIESNGAGFRKECIIDIAIFKYDGHKIVDQFISLVNPESDITPFVQKLTNISPKMVKTAPKFHELAKRVVEITEGTTLVGHNIDFDYRMLRQSFQRLGYDFKINTLDTIPLAKKLIPDEVSYSLGKLVKSLGIPLVNAHRAEGDARATLELFKLLLSKDTNNEIIQEQHEETNAKNYINKIKLLTQDLPNEKGFVYFQNEAGKIIFSDYVQDINKFSKKLFNSKSKKWENIQTEVEQINFELTGTDIIAKLILNSKGIKKRETLPFGLYFRNDKYVVEKNTLNKTEKPILKFKAFTQGSKAVQFISKIEEFKDINAFKKKIDFRKRNELWLGSGRKLGEKLFLIIDNGKVTSYGFYELFTQIQTMSKIAKLKIDLPLPTNDLINDLQLAILRGDFETLPLPK